MSKLLRSAVRVLDLLCVVLISKFYKLNESHAGSSPAVESVEMQRTGYVIGL
jgi:hypothetical protein